MNTHPLKIFTDDSGPLLWDTAQLVPAVFRRKQSLMRFSGVDVHTAGRAIFHPRLRFLTHIRQRGDWGAQIHHNQTYLRADNSAERRVLCFSKAAHNHGILVDALLRWPSYCLNGFQALMWNESFEKGTHSNEDKVIKPPQLSLDPSFCLNCVCCVCSRIRNSWGWCSFSVYMSVFLLLLPVVAEKSVSFFLPIVDSYTFAETCSVNLLALHKSSSFPLGGWFYTHLVWFWGSLPAGPAFKRFVTTWHIFCLLWKTN